MHMKIVVKSAKLKNMALILDSDKQITRNSWLVLPNGCTMYNNIEDNESNKAVYKVHHGQSYPKCDKEK